MSAKSINAYLLLSACKTKRCDINSAVNITNKQCWEPTDGHTLRYLNFTITGANKQKQQQQTNNPNNYYTLHSFDQSH